MPPSKQWAFCLVGLCLLASEARSVVGQAEESTGDTSAAIGARPAMPLPAQGRKNTSLADAIAAAPNFLDATAPHQAAGDTAEPSGADPQAAGDTVGSEPAGDDPASPSDQRSPARAALPSAINGPDDEVIIIGSPSDAVEGGGGVGSAGLGPPISTAPTTALPSSPTKPPGAALKDAAEAATFEAHTGKEVVTPLDGAPDDSSVVTPLAAPDSTPPKPVYPQYVREDGSLVRRRAVGIGLGVALAAAVLAILGGVAYAVHKRRSGFGRMAEVQMQAAPGGGGGGGGNVPAGGA